MSSFSPSPPANQPKKPPTRLSSCSLNQPHPEPKTLAAAVLIPRPLSLRLCHRIQPKPSLSLRSTHVPQSCSISARPRHLSKHRGSSVNSSKFPPILLTTERSRSSPVRVVFSCCFMRPRRPASTSKSAAPLPFTATDAPSFSIHRSRLPLVFNVVALGQSSTTMLTSPLPHLHRILCSLPRFPAAQHHRSKLPA